MHVSVTRPRTPIALIVAFALAFSGCVSGASGKPAAPGLPPSTETGGVRGLIVDDSLFPVSGATVTVPAYGLATTSDTNGAFRFEAVPAGEQVIVIEALGYASVSLKVAVAANEAMSVEVRLGRTAAPEAYFITKEGRGIFGCGATYRQGVTTVNGAFFGIAACSPLAPYGLDDFSWDTKLSESITIWRGAAFESTWRSTQTLGNGMVQDWAVIGCANNRNATFTRDTGPSPLRTVMNAFQLDYRLQDLPNASCGGSSRCNLKGCEIMNRMFSWPSTTGSQSHADVGVTIQQTYTTYITEFYRVEPPADFSALPDA